MSREDLKKTFFSDFYFQVGERGIELRSGGHPMRSVGKPPVILVRKEWVRNPMYQSCSVTVLEKGYSPLLEDWANISIRCGFLDRNYGHDGDFSRAQISVVKAFYGDSELIKHLLHSFIELRANGVEHPLRSLYVTFSLERHDLEKVRIYAQLKVDDASVFEVATDPVSLEGSREEFLLLLNQMVPSMRRYVFTSETEATT